MPKVNGLTPRQKIFISEYVRTKNGVKSALKAYNPKNYNVANNIASTNLQKPIIKQTIDKLLQEANYNPRSSIASLIEIEQDKRAKISGADRIQASKMLLTLSGLYQERKLQANYNINLNDKDKNELSKLKEKYNNLLDRKGRTPK